MFAERARDYGAHFAFCNLVGGQDELVFDGQSFAARPRRRGDRPRRPVRGGAAGLRRPRRPAPGPLAEPLADLDEVYGALVLGLRDYVAKNGFRHVGLALSGGIDSALVALLAVDALGPSGVTCVVMPSPHSSAETQEDARNDRRQPRHRADRDPDRADDGRLRAGAGRPLDPDAGTASAPPTRPNPPSPTWPRRTSRRGSAAT